MPTNVLSLTAYPFYIDGEWRESKSGETIKITSPYLYEVIGEVQAITTEEVDEAILYAHNAQKVGQKLHFKNGQSFCINGQMN